MGVQAEFAKGPSVTDRFNELRRAVDQGKAIIAIRDEPGWKILTARLSECVDRLRDELLFGEEPADPVEAKIWRAERRAMALSIKLLFDYEGVLRQEAQAAVNEIEELLDTTGVTTGHSGVVGDPIG